MPSIFIKSEVDKNLASKLKEIIRKRNGQAVDNEESATHILYPHCDPLEEEYARPGNTINRTLFAYLFIKRRDLSFNLLDSSSNTSKLGSSVLIKKYY